MASVLFLKSKFNKSSENSSSEHQRKIIDFYVTQVGYLDSPDKLPKTVATQVSALVGSVICRNLRSLGEEETEQARQELCTFINGVKARAKDELWIMKHLKIIMEPLEHHDLSEVVDLSDWMWLVERLADQTATLEVKMRQLKLLNTVYGMETAAESESFCEALLQTLSPCI